MMRKWGLRTGRTPPLIDRALSLHQGAAIDDFAREKRVTNPAAGRRNELAIRRNSGNQRNMEEKGQPPLPSLSPFTLQELASIGNNAVKHATMLKLGNEVTGFFSLAFCCNIHDGGRPRSYIVLGDDMSWIPQSSIVSAVQLYLWHLSTGC